MFEVTIGKEGLTHTWQHDFLETTKCVHCSGKALIGFVAFETPSDDSPAIEQDYVCRLHPMTQQSDGLWLHDCCAVAVYFCRNCLFPTALFNEA